MSSKELTVGQTYVHIYYNVRGRRFTSNLNIDEVVYS